MTQDSDAIETLLGVKPKRNGSVKFQFLTWNGGAPLKKERADALFYKNVKELYSVLTGNDPDGVQTKTIFNGIKEKLQQQSGSKDVTFTFKVVEIDPSDKTGSFLGPMSELDRFLPSSKKEFLNDALVHLKKLPPDSNEWNRLAGALQEARNDGHLSEAQAKALKAIAAPSEELNREQPEGRPDNTGPTRLIYRSTRSDSTER